MMWGSGPGWGMGWMWAFGVLLVAGTLLLVLVLVTMLSRRSGGDPGKSASAPPSTVAGPHRAREVLDERYARGEIDTEEYQERRRALEGGDR